MDPIAAATNAVPLQPNQPTAPQPAADPTANAVTTATEGATGTETQLTPEQQERYRSVASAFVGQMYMTMWREAQRNSGN